MNRPQFSLRLLLLAITLVAALLGWKRAVWDENRLERIRQLEAELYCEEQVLAGYETPPPPPAAFSRSRDWYNWYHANKALEVTKSKLKLLKN
jgi:predicted phage-related endonuclease